MKIMPEVVSDQALLIASPSDDVRNAARLMCDREVSSVLVVDEAGKLVGIVTERDFTKVFALGKVDPATAKIEDIMTKSPDTLSPDDPARSALELMELRHYRHLPVVDEAGRPVGVVSIRDVYAAIVRGTEDVLRKTQSYVFGERYNPEI